MSKCEWFGVQAHSDGALWHTSGPKAKTWDLHIFTAFGMLFTPQMLEAAGATAAAAAPVPESVGPAEPCRSRQTASTCCSGPALCPCTWGHTMALSEEGHELDQERHPTAAPLLQSARDSSGRANRRPAAGSGAVSRAGRDT